MAGTRSEPLALPFQNRFSPTEPPSIPGDSESGECWVKVLNILSVRKDVCAMVTTNLM